jgi:hypothetical protein
MSAKCPLLSAELEELETLKENLAKPNIAQHFGRGWL